MIKLETLFTFILTYYLDLRNKNNIDPFIVQNLSDMMYTHNTHANSFEWQDKYLIKEMSTTWRVYNQPIVSEVVALIVGDVDTIEERDIIMLR